MWAYAITIFAGAFLLFQVQPLIGKYLLPWFGGTPAVWTTCLLFFQTLLLAGYAYAHVLSRLTPRRQVLVHLLVLCSALACLPIIPAATWKPQDPAHPTLRILWILAATLGLPYFVLSASSPLLQLWLVRTQASPRPYRLYALSNAGSLLALMSYPVIVEPHITRHTQARLWGLGLIAYAGCCSMCLIRLWRLNPPDRRTESLASVPKAVAPAKFDRLLWVLLPACASVLLSATTNRICQDVATIPFLWIVPLAMYLLSWIICFDHPRWYVRVPFILMFIATASSICWVLFNRSQAGIGPQLVIYIAGLFVCCMICHGELYRRRPVPSYLTQFYLYLAFGGALGAFFVAVLAPLLFTDYYELHWGLWLCGVLLVVAYASEPRNSGAAPIEATNEKDQAAPLGAVREWFARQKEARWLGCTLSLLGLFAIDWFFAAFSQNLGEPAYRFSLRLALWSLVAILAILWVVSGQFKRFSHWRSFSVGWMVTGLLALATTLWMQTLKSGGGLVSISRNFYGVLSLYENDAENPQQHQFILRHGRITHGLQFTDPQKARWPTAYYGLPSGIGRVMSALPSRPVRIGLVGLGTGTLATYCRLGDHVRIYEINPEVERLALSRFTYLSNCPGKIELVSGDARLSLEREASQQFDLLVLDAFNSDAIPVHLLTREAFAVYERHLQTNGVIAIHISNDYLDLEPVVRAVARQFAFRTSCLRNETTPDSPWLYRSTWALLTRDDASLSQSTTSTSFAEPGPNVAALPLWTDDFASLFPILKPGLAQGP